MKKEDFIKTETVVSLDMEKICETLEELTGRNWKKDSTRAASTLFDTGSTIAEIIDFGEKFEAAVDAARSLPVYVDARITRVYGGMILMVYFWAEEIPNDSD